MAEEELIEHSEHGPAKPEVQIRVREEEISEERNDSAEYGEGDQEDRPDL
jgi:hypothetical protein